MHQRKSKKILIYIFLFVLVGSINNYNLINKNIYEIKNIYISSLSNLNNKLILEEIKSLKFENIFNINKKEINTIFDKNTLIQNFEIFRKYPSSLEIKIEETKFLAKISRENKTFLVGSNGKLTIARNLNEELPYIFGRPGIKEFLNFKKIVDDSQFSYDQIKNLYFYPSQRWDIELKNNIILKLPKNHLKKTLNFSKKFLNDSNFKNIQIIDARVKNQIILND